MSAPYPQVGDIWLYKAKQYRIEKFTEGRTKDGWVQGVNYVPLVPIKDAPNDYWRTMEDFLSCGFEFVIEDARRAHLGDPAFEPYFSSFKDLEDRIGFDDAYGRLVYGGTMCGCMGAKNGEPFCPCLMISECAIAMKLVR